MPSMTALMRMLSAAGFAAVAEVSRFTLCSAPGKHNFSTPHGVVHGAVSLILHQHLDWLLSASFIMWDSPCQVASRSRVPGAPTHARRSTKTQADEPSPIPERLGFRDD